MVNALYALAMVAAAGLIFQPFPAQGSQSVPTRIDVSKLGPQIGERAPDFRLPDQTGRLHTLSSIVGPKGVMLVFIRSADW